MNRKQRRKQEKQQKTEKFYTISNKKLEEIKENVRKDAISEAFVLMLGMSVMTISDHINDLYRLKGYEKGREERFSDYVLKLLSEYNEGRFELQDILDTLNEECGLTINMDSETKRIIL